VNFRDSVWVSLNANGDSVIQQIERSPGRSVDLHFFVKNDSADAVSLVVPLAFDTSVYQLDTAYIDTSDFPNWGIFWGPSSYVIDTIIDESAKVLFFLNNPSISSAALPRGTHHLGVLRVVPNHYGESVLNPALYPPSYGHIYYVSPTYQNIYPSWFEVEMITSYADLDVSPDSMVFFTEGGDSTFVDSIELDCTSGYIIVDSIVTSADWIDVEPESLEVPRTPDKYVHVTVKSQGLPAGIYTDTVWIYSSDPNESPHPVPVTFNVARFDKAWLSLDPSGTPWTMEAYSYMGDSLAFVFALRSSSDTIHRIYFPVGYDPDLFNVIDYTIDSSIFPNPGDWELYIIDTTDQYNRAAVFLSARNSSAQSGLPPGFYVLGSFAFEAIYQETSQVSMLDTLNTPLNYNLRIAHYDPTIYYYPDWVPVTVESEIFCGDADGTGVVTPADGYCILNSFYGATWPVSCWAANVDGQPGYTPADGYWLLNSLGAGPGLNCQMCVFRESQRKNVKAEEH
jgi:hypothetical protein